MAAAPTIDVSRLIDERPIDRFSYGLIVASLVVFLFDGYDITVLFVAMPQLKAAWQVTNPLEIGTVLSANLLGIFLGSPLFGYAGDHFGRKKAMVASCLTFGVFTLAAVWATSMPQMGILRLLAGTGIGGLMPNVLALNAEYAPRRRRATILIVMFTGVPLGGALPGLVAKTLVPAHGWELLFWIGGLAPIAMAGLIALVIPESIKFLVVRGRRRAMVETLVRRLDPHAGIGPDTRILVRDEKHYTGLSPRHLFGDGMALITPLLWLCFALNLMAYFFLASWMPTLLVDAKVLSPADAGVASMLLQFGGVVGSLILCLPMDRKGLLPITVMFACAVPVIGSIGFLSGSVLALSVAIFFAGFCVLGLQGGLNAIAGMIYPTAFRSNGTGWALAVGRIGSFVGPFVGGFLLKARLPLPDLFMAAAIPSAVGTLACFLLMRRYRSRFGGHAIDHGDPLEQAAATR